MARMTQRELEAVATLLAADVKVVVRHELIYERFDDGLQLPGHP